MVISNLKPTYVSMVGTKTDPIKLATSIQLSLISGKNVELLAMGKGAVYIANKAVCITENFAEQNGLKLNWKPSFKTINGKYDGQPRCAMSWLVWTS
ncbi:stage V sporulation protein S [Clostridium sp. SHJSY1]|uniref:stage V sporulation protein S n=1 Tax=Clostridium sp. SHJSY1 TaxID=2942483 RepID=UPI0028769FBD|nr:stage V sporulation protein S [Clostridium sp. SHJSY1]MDS0527126.1 stage V sporulation protein S [Clostridium sp. SHJSY1]